MLEAPTYSSVVWSSLDQLSKDRIGLHDSMSFAILVALLGACRVDLLRVVLRPELKVVLGLVQAQPAADRGGVVVGLHDVCWASESRSAGVI